MKLSSLLPLTIALGLILLALAYIWPSLESSESRWSMEDYNAYQGALAEGHELSHELEHASASSAKELEERHEKARDEVNQLNAKLQEAREGSLNTFFALKWSGIVLISIGVVGLVARQSSD